MPPPRINLGGELLDVRPIGQGFATLIPGIGQLIEQVQAPLTQGFRIEGDTVRMNDRISFALRPMVGVIGVATESETIFNGFAGQHGATDPGGNRSTR